MLIVNITAALGTRVFLLALLDQVLLQQQCKCDKQVLDQVLLQQHVPQTGARLGTSATTCATNRCSVRYFHENKYNKQVGAVSVRMYQYVCLFGFDKHWSDGMGRDSKRLG